MIGARAAARKRWNELRNGRARGAPDLEEAIEFRLADPLPVSDVPVLTDDYAPTDSLLVLE